MSTKPIRSISKNIAIYYISGVVLVGGVSSVRVRVKNAANSSAALRARASLQELAKNWIKLYLPMELKPR